MRLPLFPLRTVLFPGGVLPLKVFEQRYVDMTKSCLADERMMDAEPRIALPPGHEALVRLLELIAARVGPANFPAETDYDDASWIGYRLAEFLPLPLSIKQTMLEVSDAAVRLQVLQRFLREQGVV